MPETARMVLRPPLPGDAEAFAAINADPEVARFVSPTGPLFRAESDLLLGRMLEHWETFGFGWWMADHRETGELLGLVGLQHPRSLPDMAGEVEVGWRLGRAHWGRGLATEGGAEAVRVGFEERGLDRLISIIDPRNERSLAVAGRLGFTPWRTMEHPSWPPGVVVHRLERPAT